ncbi:MAG: ABC transporter permease, partial [Gemmatimonadales bacterium]
SLGSLSDEPTTLTPPRGPLDGLGADLRFALRLHRRRPAVTALVIGTLGLAIGASTAIYSVVKPTLLDALPYPSADRLAMVWERDEAGDNNVGFTTFADLRDRLTQVDAMAALSFWSPTWLGNGNPIRLSGRSVSASFFGLLGVPPALGRDFTPADDHPGAERVAIVSHRLWTARMAADPRAVGTAISLDGYPFTVIGVLPETFESLIAPGTDIWRPLRYDVSLDYACRDCRHLRAVARLAPTATFRTAGDELDRLAAGLRAEYPNVYGTHGMRFEPLRSFVAGNSRAALTLLFGAVVLVLGIACVNVANVLLSQAVQRHHEFAVRMAVGSGRQRLVRQVLLESVTLGLAGAAVAVLLTWLLFDPIRVAAAVVPRANAVAIDWQVLAFGGGAGLLAGIAFGVLPAFASLESAGAGLRIGGRVTARHGIRRSLIVAEVAVAAVLVLGAVFLTRAMQRVTAVDPGFESTGRLTANIQVAGQEFGADSVVWSYWNRVRDQVAAVPGVTSVALVSQLPMGGNFDAWGVRSEDRARLDPNDAVSADRYAVTPGYFETMGIALRKGRFLGEADRGGTEPVAVVGETLVQTYFRGADPVGQRIKIGGGDRQVWRTVVGVVADVRHRGPDAPASPQVYLPTEQWIFADGTMDLVARTAGAPAGLLEPVRAAIRTVNPNPTIDGLRPLDAVIASALERRRLVLGLFAGFAALSLALAGIGIYGVMASGVAERTREFGVRAALGASAARLRRAVLRESLTLGGIGLGFGLVLSAILARWLAAADRQLDLGDPVAFGMTAAALGTAVLVAAWLPARRAASSDPAVTLRGD